MDKLSINKFVVTPKSWDDIEKYIETFEDQAYATVLAMMVYNYTLKQFSLMGAYSFSDWKQEYHKDVN